jgi:hypothetical protein
MGAVNAVWTDNVAERLVERFVSQRWATSRRQLGRERGGRKLAADIAQRVADGVA